MSLFNSIINAVTKGVGDQSGLLGQALENPRLMEGVMGLLSKDSEIGGVEGLLANFQQAGLGDAVQSWLGDGANEALGPDQVAQALGPDTVQQLAERANMDPTEASDVLATALPDMIDKLTPQGQVQDMDMGSLQSMLGGFLKGKL
jgi:uncharacterized protein YidB (DUF937 family)